LVSVLRDAVAKVESRCRALTSRLDDVADRLAAALAGVEPGPAMA
jgi:hypothetical protein